MDKRVLVVGGTGLVGSALMRRLEHKSNLKLLGTCYTQVMTDDCVYMEMENPMSIAEIFGQFQPHEVYVTAAITDVDRCENDVSTRKVNVDAIANIVKMANRHKTKIILFSSSYVFDGNTKTSYTIYDKPMPINEYGRQKFLAERSVLYDGLDGNLVVRTVGVFGKEDARKNFAYKVVDNIMLGNKVYAPDDQYMNPIISDDLASATIRAVELGYNGVLHIAGAECVSKYEFALDIARTFRLDESMIIPVTSDKLHQPAKRPTNACLKNTVTSEYNYLMSLDRFADAF